MKYPNYLYLFIYLVFCGLNLFTFHIFLKIPKYRVDKTIIIPARAGFIKSNGTTEWKSVVVIDYLESSNTYLVKWDDSGETSWLPRQYFRFSIT